MELVPIIYTALLVVSFLTIATITVSYITFKIKHKRGKVETPTIGKMAQPVIKVEQSVKKVVKRITKPLLPPLQPIVKESNVKIEKNHTSPKEDSYSTTDKLEQLKSSSRSNEGSNRIEVVKNIKPLKDDRIEKSVPPPQSHKPESKTNSNLKSLGDKIIDKYADNHNDKMFTLNVKRDEDKKND